MPNSANNPNQTIKRQKAKSIVNIKIIQELKMVKYIKKKTKPLGKNSKELMNIQRRNEWILRSI